jgi:sec-independent protein translocase protein TatA
VNSIAFAGLPGGPEVLVVLFVVLLLFGAKKLPDLSRSLGRSLGEFKKGKEDLEREIQNVETDLHKATTEEIKEQPKAAPTKHAEKAEPKSESEPAEPDRS